MIDYALTSRQPVAQTQAAPAGVKPKIVVLSGSSRYCDVMAVCAWLLERDEGVITMGLHLLPAWYPFPENPEDSGHLAEHENVASEMDALHLCKIDLADELFVVNVRDYIGNSTRREIEYAQAAGKPIRWYTHDSIGKQVNTMLQDFLKRQEVPQ